MTKKVSKIFLYAFLSLIVLVVALIGYTQTGVFRSNLRSFLYKTVKSNLNASVYFGEIQGNLFSGFTIDTVMIYVDSKPFVESGRISVNYNLLDILDNKIAVHSLRIENPHVYLFRGKDSSWNVDHLLLSHALPDSAPSKIVIEAGKITLHNASFSMIDSTGDIHSFVTIDGKKSINYSNMFFNNINLEASGLYSANGFSASIKTLSLVSPREKFVLNNLSADVAYRKDSAKVSNLTIKTPNSQLTANAEMSGVNVLNIKDIKDLEDIPTKASILSSDVAMMDVQTFLPVLYFLKGSVFIDALFQGTFAQLNVKKLDASFANTSIHLSGAVSNLHIPKELRLNIVSKQSTISPMDIPELLPYFNIPHYPDLGVLTMDFQYVGKPLDFMVVSNLKSSAGNITVDGEMMITEKDLHYKGLVSGQNVNLEKIFSTPDLASRLNAKTYIEGKGTSIDALDAEAKIELDSSSFRGIPVSSAALELKAKEKKINSSLTVFSPDGNIRSSANMDFTEPVPSYVLSAQVRQLNVAPFVQDNYYTSRLSFDLTRSSKSFDFLNGNADTHIKIFPSVFREYAIDTSDVVTSIKTDSSNVRTITVQSPVADGTISGFFTFQGFLHSLNSSIKQFKELYAYQRRMVDSSYIVEKDSLSTTLSDSVFHKMDYDITVKDLRPISILFKLPSFDVVGNVSGHMEGNKSTAKLEGKMDLKRIFITQDSTTVQGRNVKIDYAISDADSLSSLSQLPLKVALHSQIGDLMVNQTIFKQSDIVFNVSDTSSDVQLNTDIDTMMSIGVEGKVSFLSQFEQFHLSKLRVKYQGFELENSTDVTFRLNPRGFELDSSFFIHRDLSLLMAGKFHFNGAIKAMAVIKNFDLPDIHYFSAEENFRQNTGELGGTMNAEIELNGTSEDPHFTIVTHGDSLSYKNSPIGDLSGIIRYSKTLASIDVQLSDTKDSATAHIMTVQGDVPVDLRFHNVTDRTGLEGLKVTVSSSNLYLSALDPFIPELKNVQGLLQSHIILSGSLKNPAMHGKARLDSGLFIFESNGLQYTVSGTVSLDSNRISFSDFRVQNVQSDFNGGGVAVGGYILMKGFAPNEYHLTANGELLALSSRSRTPGSSFFGTLPITTGSDSLHFDGTFDRSRVSGIVYVDQASLLFPPTQQTSSYAGPGIAAVQFVDDTSKPVLDTLKNDEFHFIPSTNVSSSEKKEKTFLDGFGYNLTIQTQGSMSVDMIFNPNAGSYEELYAVLNGKLVLSKNENGVQLTGTIEVGNESYYKFYKIFNATGSLTFAGDPANPQLNIVATYEGIHRPDETNTSKDEKAIVTLTITGDRLAPKLKIGLKTVDVNGKETERTGDVENDAIAFLLTSSAGTPGKFRDELTVDDRTKIGNQLASAITGSFLNSMLSGAVMGFVDRNNIPFVKTFELRDVGTDPTKTDIRVGGQIFDATLNLGGRVFSDVNNTNISLQYPLGDKRKRNFMLEVEKKTEDYDYSIQTRTTLGARIFYRFTF